MLVITLRRLDLANIILDFVFTNRPWLIKKLKVQDKIADYSIAIINITIMPNRIPYPKRIHKKKPSYFHLHDPPNHNIISIKLFFNFLTIYNFNLLFFVKTRV